MFTDARLPTASSALQRLVVVWRRELAFANHLSTGNPNLILRVEINPTAYTLVDYLPNNSYLEGWNVPLAIESDVAQDTPFVTTPSKHRERDWNRHINTNLTNVHFRLKFACCCAGLRKNNSTVTVGVCIDDVKSVVQCVRGDNGKYRTKDLLTSRGMRHNTSDKRTKNTSR